MNHIMSQISCSNYINSSNIVLTLRLKKLSDIKCKYHFQKLDVLTSIWYENHAEMVCHRVFTLAIEHTFVLT